MSAPGILNIAEYKYFISKFTIATSVTLSGGGAALIFISKGLIISQWRERTINNGNEVGELCP